MMHIFNKKGKDKKMKKLGILSIVLAVLLIISATVNITLFIKDDDKTMSTGGVIVADGMVQENLLTVQGEGIIAASADVAYVQIGVENKDKDVSKAQSENANIATAVLKAIKGKDLKDEDISTTNYSIEPRYDYKGDNDILTPESYIVANIFKLRIKDIDTVGEIIDAAIAAGANRAYNIYFDIQKPKQLRDEALTYAVKNARIKADLLAEAAGMEIVGIKSITDNTYGAQVYGGDANWNMSYAREEMAVQSVHRLKAWI